MIKLFCKGCLSLFCALVLFSCAQELVPESDNSHNIVIPEGYTLQTFSAITEQTKTSIISGNTVWNKEDKIRVLYTMALLLIRSVSLRVKVQQMVNFRA